MTSNPLRARVTVFHGDNQLEIEERLDAARASVDPQGLSTSTFEQPNVDLSEVHSAVGSPGFFGADRLVICRGLAGGAKSGRRGKSKSADGGTDPLSFVANVAPGVWLILVEHSLPTAEERRIRKLGPDVHVEALYVPRNRALIDWTCERARTHRAVIDGATATRLVEALFPGTWRQKARRDDVPPNMHRLDAELQKLALAAGEDGEITGDLVAELVPNADELDIWGLSNAIADRDQRRAIKQVELALSNGQAPEMILGQLAAQFETFAVVESARGRPLESVASRTGLSEGRLKQASRAARQYARTDIARALCEIRQVDFGTKQGHFEPEDALVGLVSALARR